MLLHGVYFKSHLIIKFMTIIFIKNINEVFQSFNTAARPAQSRKKINMLVHLLSLTIKRCTRNEIPNWVLIIA